MHPPPNLLPPLEIPLLFLHLLAYLFVLRPPLKHLLPSKSPLLCLLPRSPLLLLQTKGILKMLLLLNPILLLPDLLTLLLTLLVLRVLPLPLLGLLPNHLLPSKLRLSLQTTHLDPRV